MHTHAHTHTYTLIHIHTHTLRRQTRTTPKSKPAINNQTNTKANDHKSNYDYTAIFSYVSNTRHWSSFSPTHVQIPPEAWLRMGLSHGSITWVSIKPSGRVSLNSLGVIGHMPPKKISSVWFFPRHDSLEIKPIFYPFVMSWCRLSRCDNLTSFVLPYFFITSNDLTEYSDLFYR